MSAEPIVCTNCGASLQPQILETRVKCTYCETIFTIVRDHDGFRGLAPPGGTAPSTTAPVSTTSSTSASSPPNPFGGAIPSTGIDPQTIARLERDAVMVVRGLEAVEETAFAARGIARAGTCGCTGVVLLALSVAGLIVALVV